MDAGEWNKKPLEWEEQVDGRICANVRQRAITPIPAGAEAYDEEPPGEPYDDDDKEK
jgi:hypothetical protein